MASAPPAADDDDDVMPTYILKCTPIVVYLYYSV